MSSGVISATPLKTQLATKIADCLALAVVCVSGAVGQHVESLLIEPAVVAPGVLAAVLDTHIVGTRLAKELDYGAKMRSHLRKHFR
jgi:hypothetical protein